MNTRAGEPENGLSRISILVANPLHTYANLSLLPDHSTTLGIRAISQVTYAWLCYKSTG
jgi:hypothetical protein